MSHHGADDAGERENRRLARIERAKDWERRCQKAGAIMRVERPKATNVGESAPCNCCDGETALVVDLGAHTSSSVRRLCRECAAWLSVSLRRLS